MKLVRYIYRVCITDILISIRSYSNSDRYVLCMHFKSFPYWYRYQDHQLKLVLMFVKNMHKNS